MIKKTYTNIIIGIIIILAVVVGCWLLFPRQIAEFPEEEVEREIIKEKVFLVIDDGKESPQTFEAEFEEGMTAFDLLKNKAEELNLVLKTETYDAGIFIEAIGDKENGEDGRYWLYYVNGEMPMVAADKQEINPGDKIEFKFEESPF